MRVDWLYIDQFKNLKDFEIDFDENSLTSVLIGENGTGKSNLIEALISIFRDLYLEERSEFEYGIKYEHTGRTIKIESDTEPKSQRYHIWEDGDKITLKQFEKEKDDFLPSHIFAYYSGPNRRIESYFDDHLREFYQAQRTGKSRKIRPLFLARHVHSQFVLQAFYAFPTPETKKLLQEYLHVTDLESVLFELKEPEWEGDKSAGDQRFWYATGTVKDFLDSVWAEALAPIRLKDSIREEFYKQPSDEERLYLYLKDQEALQQIAAQYETQREFFKHLESTYVSDLIREVRTIVRVEDVDGNVTFRELSEGEQQLLTVLGLLQFTKGEESLFLLDEPDTHLNPIWKMHYLQTIKEIVGPQAHNSHLILLTHNPLTIAGLQKEQVQIFERDRGEIKVRLPDDDPRGKGVAGVLTEMFGLPSTLDPETQELLSERNQLFAKEERTEEEERRMEELSSKLARMGFTESYRAPLYERFIKALVRRPEFKDRPLNPEDRRKQNKIANEVLDEILSSEQ